MFGTLGPLEILLIFAVIMILFGAKKLPDIGKGLGRAISNFKKSVKEEPRRLKDVDEEDEIEEAEEEEPKAEKKARKK